MTEPTFELGLDTLDGGVELTLRWDGNTRSHEVRLADHRPALWEGVFDTQAFIERYSGSTLLTDAPATAKDLLRELGLFVGRHVLGEEITGILADGNYRRTLLVRLPPTAEDDLAVLVARLPWEIARTSADEKPLMGRNVNVRTVMAELPSQDAPWTGPDAEEAIRVLLVFADEHNLAMRREREALRQVFHEVMPHRLVEVEVLCHGVSKTVLREAVRRRGGYHVVHWSGHGHRDLLALSDDEPMTGDVFASLFEEAGGFIPRLVFLSACLSGVLIRNREDFVAAVRGEAPPAPSSRAQASAPGKEVGRGEGWGEGSTLKATEDAGFTSTALALRRAGVPHVVAMRYSVGDVYARDLAVLFYRRLFADGHDADHALALARRELYDRDDAGHSAVDHATPLFLGPSRLTLSPRDGRSPALDRWHPQPQPLLPGSRELEVHERFVGRYAEIRRLRDGWLDANDNAVAVVQGLAGMGKTSIAAEAIHLYHERFRDGVFCFQSKPHALPFYEFLRRLDQRLALSSRPYNQLCDRYPGGAVFLQEDERLGGEERRDYLCNNVVAVCSQLDLLLVLDNFETHLKSNGRCADPDWDVLLGRLADGLRSTRSRLLLTSRHRPAALKRDALWIPLGPLPMREAVLFFQENETLRGLFHGPDTRKTALRLLEVSRGHPLILERLGRLAGKPDVLGQALDELSAESGLGRLPDVFTAGLDEEDKERERRYLEDVAVGSVDLLLRRSTADARRLLWMLGLALEPQPDFMIGDVWEEGSDAPLAPLLAELVDAGLVTRDETSAYSVHELVRERVAAWMEAHPDDQGGRTDAEVWKAFGIRYGRLFHETNASGQAGAQDVSSEMGRRGISYLVRANAFEELGSFAGWVVTGTRDPRLLRGVAAELMGVVEEVPAGRIRWQVRTYVADALKNAGHPDAALAFYEAAAKEAEASEHWKDVGWICQNWANGLVGTGQLDAAKATFLRSAEAKEKAGSPRVAVLSSELEAFRVSVMQGKAVEVLPKVESRLDEIRSWWRRRQDGDNAAQTPHPEILGRGFVSGLNIAAQAYLAMEHWEDALRLHRETEEALRTMGRGELELAGTRFNQSWSLLELGRLDEAQRTLEGCRAVFRRFADSPREARVLSALADLWRRRGDLVQAERIARQSLAAFNRLPDLLDRSISHGNLSNYLDQSEATREGARHLLAAIVYGVVMNNQEELSRHLKCLDIDVRRAADAGGRYELPRLADVLGRPEFSALKDVVDRVDGGADALQAVVDQLVEGVRGEVGQES